jgi:hypothetical protein
MNCLDQQLSSQVVAPPDRRPILATPFRFKSNFARMATMFPCVRTPPTSAGAAATSK